MSTLKGLFSLPCFSFALILKTTLEMRLKEKLYNSVLFLECQCLQCSAVQCIVQGSVENVARRLGKCRSDRRMQIPCMVLIIEDVVFHVFLLLGFALDSAECAYALTGAATVRLHLIIPSPHSGLQLERESHRHDSYPQVVPSDHFHFPS